MSARLAPVLALPLAAAARPMLKTAASLLVVLALTGCQSQPEISTSAPETAIPPATADAAEKAPATPLWSSNFQDPDWLSRWEPRQSKSWGLDNIERLAPASGPFGQVLRVRYPAGSASPSVSRQTGAPLGGAQFYADLFLPGSSALRLNYYVRFAKGFDFVKGGKLPGVFGGKGASGGKIPNGTDGFSVRLMWREQGQGELYAYLPTSERYGTSIARGAWRFEPGIWYRLEQEVRLNRPDGNDGEMRLWVNDRLVIDQGGLVFRTDDGLQIDGIFFSTFFGGGDPSWATPQDTYIEFADFSVTAVD